jgi:alkanesulfonate monooxygenase SsuD/methylene tetrahydromethanopterin reductase-like flavin-dependent oxidoreductase (luciferase family)
MRIGISLTSSHRIREPREGARWMIERTAAAREAGLDSLFVGDHHSTGGAYYQNVPIMGRLLAEWGDAPAGCLFLLPLWNPVLLAEQVGTLASIAEGRFIVQTGLGDGREQFEAMGANIKHRPSAFEESLDCVKRLLAGETVSSEGRFTFTNARVSPRPPEPVEWWLGGSARVAIERAARLGDGWLAAPSLSPAQAERQLSTYLEACILLGKAPGAVAIRRDVYVGESEQEARSVADPIIDAGYRGFDPDAPIFGSIDQVAARFRELEALGYTDVIVRHLTDDQEKVLSSLRRMKEVRVAVS